MNRRELFCTAALLGPGALVPAAAQATSSDPTEGLRQEARERWATLGFETRVLAIGGTSIHVALGGQGTPIVFLHGYPQSGEIWRGVAPSLARQYRIIIPDLRGMGLSDPGTGPHRLITAAEDVAGVLAALGVSQAAVVGHDWGGAVGATLALAHRKTATRLVFIESAIAGAGFEQLWRFDTPNPALTFIPFLLMQGVAETLVAGREEIFLRHLWETFTGDRQAAPFDTWAPYVAAIQRPGQFTASADYYRSAYTSAEDSKRLLADGKLAIPVLPVAGERSFGPANEAMAKNFSSDVRPSLVLAGTGHFVPEERPHELLAAIQTFLA